MNKDQKLNFYKRKYEGSCEAFKKLAATFEKMESDYNGHSKTIKSLETECELHTKSGRLSAKYVTELILDLDDANTTIKNSDLEFEQQLKVEKALKKDLHNINNKLHISQHEKSKLSMQIEDLTKDLVKDVFDETPATGPCGLAAGQHAIEKTTEGSGSKTFTYGLRGGEKITGDKHSSGVMPKSINDSIMHTYVGRKLVGTSKIIDKESALDEKTIAGLMTDLLSLRKRYNMATKLILDLDDFKGSYIPLTDLIYGNLDDNQSITPPVDGIGQTIQHDNHIAIGREKTEAEQEPSNNITHKKMIQDYFKEIAKLQNKELDEQIQQQEGI